MSLSEALRTLALCLAAAGRGSDAEAAASRAVQAAQHHGHALARARAQRGLIHLRLGNVGWEDDLSAALDGLQRLGDAYWVATIRLNRGMALLHGFQLDNALADFTEAARLQGALGNARARAFAIHNIGLTASRRGDLPLALASYDEAEQVLDSLGIDTTPGALDRSETWLTAGMTHDAISLLRGRLASEDTMPPALVPEGHLLLARALLASADHRAASRSADQAATTFARQSRPGWELLARGAHALATLPLGDLSPTEAAPLADEVEAGGWPDVAADIRAAAAVQAAEADDLRAAEELLQPLAHQLDALPLAPQLGVAQARMAISGARGDSATVLEHATDALERLEERRVLLGASELRAGVTRLAKDILTRATLASLELGDLDRALEWVDHARSQALDQPPVVPPEDEQLADDLGRLRVISDQLARKRAEGEAVTDLLTEKEKLERRVRDRTRTASGARTDATTASARQRRTTEIAYLDLGEHLAALVADDTSTRRVDLTVDRDTVVNELDALGFALQRVGAARSPGRRRDLAARSLDHSLATLNDALVAPLGLGTDNRVVVSPTSVLFDVPWSGLPALVDRPVAVAPALRLSRRPQREDAGTGTLLLEGPRLAHARAELDALAEVVADPRTILGEEGTVAAAKEALPEVAIAHLACHGVFRADNPQFSSLELADGPMFVYDLESLPRVPELIVLSACQTGRSAVHVGDELLGVTASLLALGARTVVAALADVPDDLSALLMVAFHQHVRAGAHPAEALAHARRTLLATRDEPAARLTAAAFVCLGAL